MSATKAKAPPHILDDVSRMAMVNGLVTLVCWIAQVCVVTKRVALFRTPYSPVIDHAARIHAKRTVLLLTISDEDTENI